MKRTSAAFTLIELLVVISIIAVLIGLAFPAFQGVQNSAKRTQAKNDLVQLVTAVNAFYTEYGKYPVDPAGGGSEATYGNPGTTNDALLDVLRSNTRSANNAALVASLNPRQVSFITPPEAKSTADPRAGVSSTTGEYFDPWGSAYRIRIDANYDNEVANPYPDAGSDPLRHGVISWSLGKNGALGGGPAAAPKFGSEAGSLNNFSKSSDVISWQ